MPMPRNLKLWLIGLFAAFESAIVGAFIGVLANGWKIEWEQILMTSGGVAFYSVFKYFQTSPLSNVLREIVTEEKTVTTTQTVTTKLPDLPHDPTQ